MGSDIKNKYVLSQLIKGISYIDAICFMIDNSLDAMEKDNNSSKEYIIKINVSKGAIIVEDNCLGVSHEELKNKMFVVSDKASFNDGLGAGLKRSIVKLGQVVSVNSVKDGIHSYLQLVLSEHDTGELFKEKENYYYNEETTCKTIINISALNKSFKRYCTASFLKNLKDTIRRKYRYIIDNKRVFISLNNEKLDSYHIRGYACDKNIVNKNISKNITLNINMLKEIESEKESGINFIVNNRIILEFNKSIEICWRKNIVRKGHSYQRFSADIIINCYDYGTVGVSYSKDSIDFNNEVIQNILEELYILVEETRNEFSKGIISVRFYVEKKIIYKAEEVLRLEDGYSRCATEVAEKAYELGINKILDKIE